jgi:hypothetical protein
MVMDDSFKSCEKKVRKIFTSELASKNSKDVRIVRINQQNRDHWELSLKFSTPAWLLAVARAV